MPPSPPSRRSAPPLSLLGRAMPRSTPHCGRVYRPSVPPRHSRGSATRRSMPPSIQRAARRPSRAVASLRTSRRSSAASAIAAGVGARRRAGWGCKPACLELPMRHPWLLTGAPISAVALLEVAWSNELPTHWEVPPGEPLEHMTAGFAKVLCSALFITGRGPCARPRMRTGSSCRHAPSEARSYARWSTPRAGLCT